MKFIRDRPEKVGARKGKRLSIALKQQRDTNRGLIKLTHELQEQIIELQETTGKLEVDNKGISDVFLTYCQTLRRENQELRKNIDDLQRSVALDMKESRERESKLTNDISSMRIRMIGISLSVDKMESKVLDKK
jgi:hypothetical protein